MFCWIGTHWLSNHRVRQHGQHNKILHDFPASHQRSVHSQPLESVDVRSEVISLICEGTEIWNWLSSCFKREWNPTFRAFTIMYQSCIALFTVATFPSWDTSSTMCSKMPIPPIAKLPLLKSPWKQATPKWLNSSLLKAHTTLLEMCWTTFSPNNSQLKSPANTRQLILEGKLAMLWLLKILRLRTVPLRKLWDGQESGNLC